MLLGTSVTVDVAVVVEAISTSGSLSYALRRRRRGFCFAPRAVDLSISRFQATRTAGQALF